MYFHKWCLRVGFVICIHFEINHLILQQTHKSAMVWRSVYFFELRADEQFPPGDLLAFSHDWRNSCCSTHTALSPGLLTFSHVGSFNKILMKRLQNLS